MRLANGGVLSTIGRVDLRLDFNGFQYFGPFYILDCAVPLILGMSFFAKVRPQVDWAGRTVEFPTCGTSVHV